MANAREGILGPGNVIMYDSCIHMWYFAFLVTRLTLTRSTVVQHVCNHARQQK
eukprot:COSAG02_NODE_1295_length_13400_cov_5.691828_9_plen_53_part_00